MSIANPEKASKRQLCMLIMLVLFSPMAIDIYLPALPTMAKALQVEAVLAQDTVTWFLFSMGVGQLFAGPIADKYGRRTVALGGIILYGVSAYLAWVAQSIEWMLMARLLQGLGACATSVAAFATVRDMFGPKKSSRMISYLNGAICFIPALAPILGSWLTQEFGWRSNFSFMAGFAVLGVIVMLINFKETNPSCSEGALFKPSRYVSVLKHPSFIFHASLCMLGMAVILAYVTSAPVVLITNMGISMNAFTFWFGINAIINIVFCMIAPKLMDRWGTHGTLVFGIVTLLIGGAMMLAMKSWQTPLGFMLPIFMSSVGFASIMGAGAGKALAPFGDKAGTAAALLGLFQMSGSGFMVGVMQRLSFEPEVLIALHMWLLAPALIILYSQAGKNWHTEVAS
ncbi:multidrug effflux MFS transporter [Vibrio sp. S9_S30]|uniref:multidrug effflux MFS transporter n=1 Tax=Vibrio sp. S9_S30 TaxID=2720226 RepID=UPI00188C81CD|nr:multidrug effflux MFS transporter [Vibrio sp. S9_S30]MBD1559632.1 multidrug effflux MFS transporter [Vibrio sp. S9_S30]